MIYAGLNRTDEIADIKSHGGNDISEVYGGIGESNPIYYKQREMVGTSPMQFKALGLPLSDYLISGNTVQDRTPTPQAPVDVVGCGIWDETQQSYKLPLTVNGTEYPIYLGDAQTTRRIKKLVLTGTENISKNYSGAPTNYLYYANSGVLFPGSIGKTPLICDKLPVLDTPPDLQVGINADNIYNVVYLNFGADVMNAQPSGNTAAGLKEYLAQQYAAGTPVTIWYVLATPETAVVNEPLHKIGDYADTISMAQASITIPTIAGTNTLTVGTTVQPSSVSITGHIKPVTS